MSYSSEVLADSPVCYLRLGESSGTTADDISGNSIDGTYTNTPTLGVEGAIGDTDTGITVVKANEEYVDIGNDASMPCATGPYSVEFWFKATANNNGIVTKGQSRGGAGTRGFDVYGNGADLFVLLRDASAIRLNKNLGTFPTLNQWHHAVFTWDGTTDANKAIFYLNGAQLGTGTVTSTAIDDSQNWFVGGSGASWSFDGSLDEFAYYDSVLSAARVTAHYDAGVRYPDVIRRDSPVCYLRLGESAGTTAEDDTANNLDGTYTNTPTLGATSLIASETDTAVDFDNANNEHVDVGNDVSMPSNAAFSVELWFSASSASNGIMSKGNTRGGTREFDIYGNGVDLFVLFAEAGVANRLVKNCGAFPSLSATHHIAVTWDGTTTADMVKIYLDGSELTTGTVSGTVSNTQDWHVGGDSASFSFDGVIDEWAYYDAVLTPTQISEHYTVGTRGDAVTITSPLDNGGVQRDSASSHDLTISGTYGGSPTAIEASFNGGAYATIDATPTGNTFSGTLSGLTPAQGTLTVRHTNDTSISHSITITITDVFGLIGQSNICGRGTNNQSYADAPESVPAFTDNGQEALTSDPVTQDASSAGSPWMLFADLFKDSQGIPPAFVASGQGATGLVNPDSGWNKPDSLYNEHQSDITNSKVGGIKAFLWHQGESDINNDVTKAAYNSALDTLASDLNSDSSAPMVVAQVGHKTTGTPADRRTATDNVRLAQSDAWDDNANIHPGPCLYDVDLGDAGGDGVHFLTDAELQTLANRWWMAVEQAFYGGSKGRGPKIQGIEFTSTTTILLQFDKVITGGPYTATAFRVTDDGTPVTVDSAARLNARQVELTLNSATSGTVLVSLGSENDGAGATVPTAASVTLSNGESESLPAEPFSGLGEFGVTTFGGGAGVVTLVPGLP